MSKSTIACTAWTPMERGTLLGFADIHIRELRMRIAALEIHERDGVRWAAPPANPGLDHGRPLITFDTKAVGDAFSRAVCRAAEDYVFRRDFLVTREGGEP